MNFIIWLVVGGLIGWIASMIMGRDAQMGALANIIAIPLTTFVIMPLEAAALFLDLGGLGKPFWWAAGHALDGADVVSGTLEAPIDASSGDAQAGLWAQGVELEVRKVSVEGAGR